MNRTKTYWLAAALFGTAALLWWLITPPSGTPDVHLRFLYFTNNTDGLSSDDLAVFDRPEFTPPNLPPPTHAVVQLTNGSGGQVLFVAFFLTGGSTESGAGRRVTSAPIFPRKQQGTTVLAAGDSISAELNVMSATPPWLAQVQFIRFGRTQRALRRVSPYLPVAIRNWVSRRFLAVENTTLEFGDALSSLPAPNR